MKKLGHLIAILLCMLWGQAAFAQATLLPPGEQCFSVTTPTSGGTSGTGTGLIGLLGTITGGSGGTNGVYGGVPLTGGSGSNATANITVSGGIVTAVAIVNPGINYIVGDTLSASSANIGNVTGFSVPVSSVSINQSLAGGTVGYYIPSTLTPKQTWQNAGETILNTNPVTLDANGCAIVYGSGIYRQILKDSLGNTIWDQLTASTNQNNPYWAGTASGTANAITITDAAFNGTAGQIVQFLPLYTNTGAATATISGLGPYSIVKDTTTGPVSLTGGEIAVGATPNVVTLIFDSINNVLHLQSLPGYANITAAALSASALGSYEQPINMQVNATVSSNQLTATIVGVNGSALSSQNPVLVGFRSKNLSNGTVIFGDVTSPISMTLASSASMGCTTGVLCRLWGTLICQTETSGTCSSVLVGLSVQSIGGTTPSCYPLLENILQSTGSGTNGGTSVNTIQTTVSSLSGVAIRIGFYIEAIWTSGTGWSLPASATEPVVQVFGPGVFKPCDVVQRISNDSTTTSTINGANQRTSLAAQISIESLCDLIKVRGDFSYSPESGVTTSTVWNVSRGTGPTYIGQAIFTGGTISNATFPATISALDAPSTTGTIIYYLYGSTSAGQSTFNTSSTSYMYLDEIMGMAAPANDNARLRAVG